MSQMSGMNTAEVRALAASFKSSADRLTRVRREIDVLVFATGWWGPDSDALRDQWNSFLRSAVSACAEALDDAGDVLRRQVEEQERASGLSEGQGGVLGWLRARRDDASAVVEHARDGAEKVLDWIEDRAEDGVAWTSDRIEDGIEAVEVVADLAVTRAHALVAGLEPYLKNWGVLGEQVLNAALGNPPQAAEFLAALLLVGGTGMGVATNVVTGRDQNLFDDGDPWTGTPRLDVDVAAPTGIGGLTETIRAADAHSGVVVTVVRNPDEAPRYIVSIPGTEPSISEPAGWTGHKGARDWPANLWGMASGESSYSRAVAEAIDKAVAADRALHGEPNSGRPEILLAGFSQGGLAAANLAADEDFRSRYQVAAVVGFGAPMDCAAVPRGIPVLSVQHQSGDLVPSTDLAGVGTSSAPSLGARPGQSPNVTTVTFGSAEIAPFGNHDAGKYGDKVATASGGNAAKIGAFEAKLDQRFFAAPEHMSSIVVEVGRTTD